MKAVQAQNVSIRYMVGDFKDIGFKEYIIKKLTGNYHAIEFWADKDVSFSLEKGDMLGIIGTNGAGKSTLLKAVAGIMPPTTGKMKVRGKIAALLELSSGFDGDLSVKENTYLRGAMMGYTRKFMDEKYREIIEFAELEEFQDRPFKQLSSGMKSRLGFSIACLVEPDIIILDEVLSVGDGTFREKSSERMHKILDSGVTGLFVSHSIGQVRELCNKILWLDHGRQVLFSDDVEMCCDVYEEFLISRTLPETEKDFKAMAARHQEASAKKEAQKMKKKEKSIKRMLASDEGEKYLEDAIKVVERYAPERLN